MQRINLKKILSVIFFLILTALLYLAVNETNIKTDNSNLIIIFFGIFISGGFLLTLNLLGRNTISTEDSQLTDKKTDHKSKDQKDDIELNVKEYVDGILYDIHKITTIKELSELILKNFAKTFQIVQGIIYVYNNSSNKFIPASSYAFFSENKLSEFETGDGIAGQVANDQNIKLIQNIADDYITVLSGLGKSSANNLLIIPVVYNNKTIAVIELASFDDFPENYKNIYKKINKTIADKFNSLIQ